MSMRLTVPSPNTSLLASPHRCNYAQQLALSSHPSTAGGLLCMSMRLTVPSPNDSLLPPQMLMSQGKLQGLLLTTGGMWLRFSLTKLITSVSKPSSCACRCAWRTLRAAQERNT
jgi:hypothetical protein